MYCPACGSKAKVYSSKMFGKDRVRYHSCSNCLTTFKSKEQIDYSSLDRYVLNKLHMKAEGL